MAADASPRRFSVVKADLRPGSGDVAVLTDIARWNMGWRLGGRGTAVMTADTGARHHIARHQIIMVKAGRLPSRIVVTVRAHIARTNMVCGFAHRFHIVMAGAALTRGASEQAALVTAFTACTPVSPDKGKPCLQMVEGNLALRRARRANRIGSNCCRPVRCGHLGLQREGGTGDSDNQQQEFQDQQNFRAFHFSLPRTEYFFAVHALGRQF